MTKGADLVFVPCQDAADRAVERIREANQLAEKNISL